MKRPTDKFDKKLGRMVRALRQKHKIPYKQICDMLAISPNSLFSKERGEYGFQASDVIIFSIIFKKPIIEFYEE